MWSGRKAFWRLVDPVASSTNCAITPITKISTAHLLFKKKDLCLLGGGTFGVRQNLIQRGTEHSSRDASPEVRRTEWEFNNGAERSSALRMRKTVLRTVYGYFTTRHFRLMRPGSLGCLNDETNTRSSGKASHRDAFDAGFTSHATLSTN